MTDHRDSNALFTGSSPGVVKLAVYGILTIGLMVADHHDSYVSQLRQTLGLITDPLVKLVNLPGHLWRSAADNLADRDHLQQRNHELEQQWLETRAQLNRMSALQAENQRLRELLQSSTRLGEKVLVAELLRVDLDPYSHRVVLNKGDRDGIYAGQPIADANGIVGQIERVSALHAYAMLISDPSHAIPVVVNRNGLRSVAYGLGMTDQLVLRDITSSADIRPGDLLVTSGLGGRFPAGFPVGTVAEIAEDAGSTFRQVRIKPSAQLDRSREVLLVWPEQAGAVAKLRLETEQPVSP